MVCVLGGSGSVMMVFWGFFFFFQKQKKKGRMVDSDVPQQERHTQPHFLFCVWFLLRSSMEEGLVEDTPKTLEKCVRVRVCRTTMSLSIVIYTHE